MAKRSEYRLALDAIGFEASVPLPPTVRLKPARIADGDALAELMIDAYRGTIDYDGETIEDALNEIHAYMDGQRGGVPLLELSRLAFREDALVSACLVAEWDDRNQPIIAYVMTSANTKRQGLAKQLLTTVLKLLSEAGHSEVRAVITNGNLASELLFRKLGFERVTA